MIGDQTGILKQDDTVEVVKLTNLPNIDGVGDDECWKDIKWQTIDQVWMPYGDEIDEDDYSGRYKIVWSDTENLLYFLVEITDDIGVDGFRPGETADIYNFDIVEVFIDEDKSGGPHAFGEDAANAFAYHIYADFPEDQGTNSEIAVGDMVGDGWSDVDFADHIPEFTIRKNGNVYTREFSLIVYDDSFNGYNEEESRVQLTEGKIMGLSIAYCENDDIDEVPAGRDNFFGSVWVSEENQNNHWLNADDFGTIKLVSETKQTKISQTSVNRSSMQLITNPMNFETTVKFSIDKRSIIHLKVFDILGKEITTLASGYRNSGTYTVKMDTDNLPGGIYLFKLEIDNNYADVKKIFLSKM